MSLAMSEHERQEFLAELEADLRPLAHRYFGPKVGDAYITNTGSEGGTKYSMRPTRWWTVDYTKSSTPPPPA